VPTGVTVYCTLLHADDADAADVPDDAEEAHVPLRAAMVEEVAADVDGDVGDAIGELLHADARTEANARVPRARRRISVEVTWATWSMQISLGTGAC